MRNLKIKIVIYNTLTAIHLLAASIQVYLVWLHLQKEIWCWPCIAFSGFFACFCGVWALGCWCAAQVFKRELAGNNHA